MDADDARPVIELRVGESAVLASPRIPTALSITDPTVAVAVARVRNARPQPRPVTCQIGAHGLRGRAAE